MCNIKTADERLRWIMHEYTDNSAAFALYNSSYSQCLRTGGKENAFNKKKKTLNIKQPFASDN